MSEQQFARHMAKTFTPEVVKRGLQDHIESSRRVSAHREAELNAVGFSQKISQMPRKPAAMTAAKKK